MSKFKVGDVTDSIGDIQSYGTPGPTKGMPVSVVDEKGTHTLYFCRLAKRAESWVCEDDGFALSGQESAKETGEPRFIALCDEMKAVHRKKGADYGSDRDVLENIRRSERVGVKPSLNAWLRASDKVGRLDKFFSGKALVNESAIDSLVDLANYCLIAVVLLEQEKEALNGSDQ